VWIEDYGSEPGATSGHWTWRKTSGLGLGCRRSSFFSFLWDDFALWLTIFLDNIVLPVLPFKLSFNSGGALALTS
jgi:hypothetical protein